MRLLRTFRLLALVVGIMAASSLAAEIHDAIDWGRVDQVRALIAQHPDLLNSRNDAGLTPVNCAANRGQLDVIKALVELGADMAIGDNEGSLPIHNAGVSGSVETIEYLLSLGVDVSIQDNFGMTALHIASMYGRTEAARCLIEKGADVNLRNYRNQTPLFNCALSGTIQTAELLLANGADINAVEDGGGTPIIQASIGNADMVRFLILHGASVDPIPCTPSPGEPCSDTPWTALQIAASNNNLDAVRALVSNGASVNTIGGNGLTPLHEAVMDGRFEIAGYLLAHGASANARETGFGMTPLHIASMKGYRDIADALIDAGADVNATDNDGRTPVDYAFYHGFERIAVSELAADSSAQNSGQHVSAASALAAQVQPGEATIWHLGHSGWAIKTANNLLIFDYNMNDNMIVPEDASLASGYINLQEIHDYNVTVFCSHGHGDHYYPGIYRWRDSIPNMQIVLGWKPRGVTEPYTYIGPRSETTLNDMNISTIRSTDAGVGFVVDVDGLTIFHAGDHANGDVNNMAPFTDEIDYIAERHANIDLAFMGIRGCSLGDPESVKAGVYYTVDKLKPKCTFPQHAGSNTQWYREFAETAADDGIAAKFVCAGCGGDRFAYRGGDVQPLLANGR